MHDALCHVLLHVLVQLLKEEGDMPHVRNAVLVGLGGGFIALFTLLAPGEALDFSIKQVRRRSTAA